MFKKYNNVFNQTYLDSVKNTLYTLFSSGNLFDEGSIHESSFGHFGKRNIFETLEFNSIKILNDIVYNDFGSNYQFTHTFSRIYSNGAVLAPHIDRLGHDLTCSLTVFRNFDKPWLIHLSNKKFEINNIQESSFLNSYSSVDIEPNEIIIFKPREHLHWRNPLECNPDQYSLHVFYHWKLIE